jgi:hypothetical protein
LLTYDEEPHMPGINNKWGGHMGSGVLADIGIEKLELIEDHEQDSLSLKKKLYTLLILNTYDIK